MLYIDAIETESGNNGYEVITHVYSTPYLYVTANQRWTKREMITHIKTNLNSVKTKYLKNGVWCVGEDVRVVDDSYLRTDANHILRDNLGNLIKRN